MKTSDLIGDVAEIDTPVPSALAVLRNLYKLKDDATSTTPKSLLYTLMAAKLSALQPGPTLTLKQLARYVFLCYPANPCKLFSPLWGWE